ncbi:MAG: hypothetical protein KA248_00300 [Kiritimatiellae bacterium]|nr:hypothetical protein [Kiritimatiellia bacterium]
MFLIAGCATVELAMDSDAYKDKWVRVTEGDMGEEVDGSPLFMPVKKEPAMKTSDAHSPPGGMTRRELIALSSLAVAS